MSKIVKEDRGTVKRITLDILYPNGQIKTRALDNTSEFQFGEFSALIFDDHFIELLTNSVERGLDLNKLKELWSTMDSDEHFRAAEKGAEARYKPTILAINTKADIVAMCGAHRSWIPKGEFIR